MKRPSDPKGPLDSCILRGLAIFLVLITVSQLHSRLFEEDKR